MHEEIKKTSSLSNRQLGSAPFGVSQADQLPDSAHLRPKACALLMGISIATFWRLVASGKLKTHKLTERTTTVKAGDLRAFMAGSTEG